MQSRLGTIDLRKKKGQQLRLGSMQVQIGNLLS